MEQYLTIKLIVSLIAVWGGYPTADWILESLDVGVVANYRARRQIS